jgi:hypothetical protein
MCYIWTDIDISLANLPTIYLPKRDITRKFITPVFMLGLSLLIVAQPTGALFLSYGYGSAKGVFDFLPLHGMAGWPGYGQLKPGSHRTTSLV